MHLSHAPSTAETWTFHDYSSWVTGKKDSRFVSSARHKQTRRKGKSTLGKRIGQTIGTVADTKDRMVDTASGLKAVVLKTLTKCKIWYIIKPG